MKTLKALLFDLDGTLIDSEICHYHCWNNLLALFGHQLDHAEYMKCYSGVSLQKNSAVLIEKFKLNTTLDDMVKQREALMLQTLLNEEINPMPYARAVIEHFAGLGVPLALITSSSAAEVEIVLRKMELESVFKVVVTRDDVSHSKPHPEAYQKGLRLLGFDKAHCIVIEDTITGVNSAKAAGLTCIAVQAVLFDEFAVQSSADVVCRDLLEAQQYIDRHFEFSDQ